MLCMKNTVSPFLVTDPEDDPGIEAKQETIFTTRVSTTICVADTKDASVIVNVPVPTIFTTTSLGELLIIFVTIAVMIIQYL